MNQLNVTPTGFNKNQLSAFTSIKLMQQKTNGTFNYNRNHAILPGTDLLKIYFLGKKNTRKLPIRKLENVQLDYNADRKIYYEDIKRFYWNLLAVNQNIISKNLPQGRPVEILSIGCGSFIESDPLTQFFSHARSYRTNINHKPDKARVVGIDIDQDRLDHSIELGQNVDIKLGDATNLSKTFGDKKFDVVVFRHPELISALVDPPDPSLPQDAEYYQDLAELKQICIDDNVPVLVANNENSPEFLKLARSHMLKAWPQMIKEAYQHLNAGGKVIATTYTEAEFLLMRDLLEEQGFEIKLAKFNTFSKPVYDNTTLFNCYNQDKYLIVVQKPNPTLSSLIPV